MTKITRALMTAVLLTAGATRAYAQEPELVTDRPDFTESSEIVRKGLAQFESGITFERDGAGTDRTRSLTAPGSLLRLGLSRRIELRLGSDGFVSQTSGSVSTQGWSDFEAGVKLRLFSQDTAGVDVAVIPMASFPTGRAGVTSGHVDPTVKLTWARDLPAGFGLSGNYNVASLSDDAGRFTQQALSFSLGHDLAASWGGYFEAYTFAPADRDAGNSWTVNGGVSRLIGSRMQLDVEVGRGLGADATNWFVGAGLAVRWHVNARR